MTKNLSIEDLRELINEGGATDPLVFLSSIMDGVDPRHDSELYDLACEIDSFLGKSDRVSPQDWHDLFTLIKRDYKYRTVSLTESVGATKTLAEYLHAKKKQVDLGITGGLDVKAEELTADEVKIFKEKFNANF